MVSIIFSLSTLIAMLTIVVYILVRLDEAQIMLVQLDYSRALFALGVLQCIDENGMELGKLSKRNW